MASPSNAAAEASLEHSASSASAGADSGGGSSIPGTPSSTASSVTASISSEGTSSDGGASASSASSLGVSDALGFMFRGGAFPFLRGPSFPADRPPPHSASAPALGAARGSARAPTPPGSPTLSLAREPAGASAGSLPGAAPSPTLSSPAGSSFFRLPTLASFGQSLQRPFQSRAGGASGPRGAPELSVERRLEDAIYLQAVIFNSSEIFAWLELGWSPGEADRGGGGGARGGARVTPGGGNNIRTMRRERQESASRPETGSARASVPGEVAAEAAAPSHAEGAKGAGGAMSGEDGATSGGAAAEAEGKKGPGADAAAEKGTGAGAGDAGSGAVAASGAQAEIKSSVPPKLQSFVDDMVAEFQSVHTAEDVHLAVAFLRRRLWREGGRVRSLGSFLEQHSQQVLHSEEGGAFFRLALFRGFGGGGSRADEVQMGNDEHLLQLAHSWVRCLQAGLRRAEAEAEAEEGEDLEEEEGEGEGEGMGLREGVAEGEEGGAEEKSGRQGGCTREKGHEHTHTEGLGCTLCIDESGNMKARKKAPKGYVSFPLLYVTNRGLLKGGKSVHHMFGSARGEGLSHGIIWVSMPDSMGHLTSRDSQEASATWRYHLSRQGTPKDSVAVLAATPIDRDGWYGAGRNIAAHAGDDRLLVYVHGYNTPFLNAVRRLALVAYTANFRGTCVLFTWPSAESTGSYGQAEDNLAWGVPDLVSVLHALQAELRPSKTHLLGHSMGCRMLLYALLRALPLGPYCAGGESREGQGRELGGGKEVGGRGDAPLYGSVVLAAPDIDRDEFFKSLPHLARGCDSVTVYCSRDDQALIISKSLHGGNFRLGDFRGMPEAQVPPECRTWRERLRIVDTTGEDSSLLNHSYIFTSCCIVMDCTLALVGEVAPGRRPWLSQGTFPSGLHFWSFQDADKYTRHSRIPFMKQLGVSLGFMRSASSGSGPGSHSNRSTTSTSTSTSASASAVLPHSHSGGEGSGHGQDGGKKAPLGGGSKGAVASKECQKIWEDKCFKWQSSDAQEDGEMLVLSMPREHIEEDDMEE